MENTHQYERCLVMAGGGFRFGYYLGIHAAAEETGHAPDLLLASCGGAVAAAAIARLPDAPARKAWLASREVHAFLAGLQSTARAAPLPMLGRAVRRWLHRAPVPAIPDLFDDYLFDLPARAPLPPASGRLEPAVAIVGGKMLFGPEDVGQARGARMLFAETVFGGARVASLLDGAAAPAADPRWSDGAIAPLLQVDSAMPLEDAVRTSLSDMFYFRCHQHAGSHYTGGVIDLFPIELARRLAASVAMERKGHPDPWLVAPAWRAVLGIDGAARLRAVHEQRADVWIDTSDMAQALRGQGLKKAIRWQENRLWLVAPSSYDNYRAQVDAQWRYGYTKGLAAFTQGQRA
ncbi:patatin-like phospholipase family protein [Pseudoduganella lutea]|uniref:patatin-like phospholipase family protein n=1 Tax=Pseudoduganella lutea TaxID=321985 RepID=UPI0013EEE0BC|nr:patatin-like phospholipase family protein [Pseudoduganella lutea]